jgi:hypothetical protein
MNGPALRGRRQATGARRAAVVLLAAGVVASSLSSCAVRRIGHEKTAPWVFSQSEQNSFMLFLQPGYDKDYHPLVKVAYWIGPGH